MNSNLRVTTESLVISTKGFNDIIDITNQVQSKLNKSGLTEGNVLIFVPGSTAAVTTMENEPGLMKDYPDFWEKTISQKSKYYHDETWHDGNGYAHIRAALQGASLTVPFSDGKLQLGTWQQIIIIDFDNRSRKRNIVVQFIGA